MSLRPALRSAHDADRALGRALGALSAALLALACVQCTNDGARNVPARPSVLLVTVDTLRADHVSAYGYARKTSPQLDALAAEGALFETAYAASSATGPSHATLFTARQPLAHGVVCSGVVLDASIPTIASLLSGAGYRTAAFVSSYVVASRFGLSHGFAHYDQDFGTSGGTMKSRRWQRERGDAGALDRRGAVTVDAASAWLEQQKDGAPLLVWVHLFDPHAPYSPPAPYDASFVTADPSQHQREIDLYDGEIRYADEQFGRLVAAFDRTTGGRGLVVVTSDHGEGLWEHGYGGHNRDVWEEEVRIPLVVRWRGKIEPGRRVAEPVHLIDVLPTVVAAAGIAPPAGASGVDLVAALIGKAELSAERLIYLTRPYFGERARKHHGGIGWGFGLRRGSWKLIEAQAEGRRNLYDLARDPEEQENRAGEEAARAAELAGLIAGWRESESRIRSDVPIEVPRDVRRRLRALGYVN